MGPMRTKDRFDETLNRCNSLMELFEKAPNGDLLRAAVVLAVAALDKYCKDKFLDFFEGYYGDALKAHANLECCDAYLDKKGIDIKVRLSLYQKHATGELSCPERDMARLLRDELQRDTFQRVDAITELFKCFGLNDIIKRAVEKSGRPDVWKSVADLIRRRHQIAHSADYGTGAGVESIEEDAVGRWLDELSQLVNCIDSIVDNKFKVTTKEPRQSPQTVSALADRSEDEFTAAHHRAKGYLDAKELSSLRRIADIEELFGVKAKRNGFLCHGSVDYPAMGNAEIWWPKIASDSNYAGWVNKAQYDGNGEIVGIVEKNIGNRESNDHALRDNIRENRLRIVLAVVEGDSCPVGYCYRFLGTFALNVDESRRRDCCVWERKEGKVALR